MTYGDTAGAMQLGSLNKRQDETTVDKVYSVNNRALRLNQLEFYECQSTVFAGVDQPEGCNSVELLMV